MNGTTYAPPQLRSGLSVEDFPFDRSMHNDTKRSPNTLAYEVKASASNMSPNFPSCASAIPPTLMRFSVLRNLYRPVFDTCCSGSTNSMASSIKYDCGRICHAFTAAGCCCVIAQKRRRDMASGIEIKLASRYTRRCFGAAPGDLFVYFTKDATSYTFISCCKHGRIGLAARTIRSMCR
jgi:hypothetical protein